MGAGEATSMSGRGRRTLEKGMRPRPSTDRKVAASAVPRSLGASSLMRSGANQRALRPPPCLFTKACRACPARTSPMIE